MWSNGEFACHFSFSFLGYIMFVHLDFQVKDYNTLLFVCMHTFCTHLHFVAIWWLSILPISVRITSLALRQHMIPPGPKMQSWRIRITCQSQSGVSLSLHLWSKMKIYLWPQKQLDMEKYRFLCMKLKYYWVIFNIHWVITFWRSPI